MAASRSRTPRPANPSYCLSTAASNLVLLCTCVYGKNSCASVSVIIMTFIPGVWSMCMENWNNFNRVFLHGHIWFGFCGGAAALGIFRFGKHNTTCHWSGNAWTNMTLTSDHTLTFSMKYQTPVHTLLFPRK